MKIYVVRVGGKLYIESKGYGLFQTTTANVLHAKWFTEYGEAEKVAKKTFGGEIIEYELNEAGSNFSDEDRINELEKRINELLELNKSYQLLLQEKKSV